MNSDLTHEYSVNEIARHITSRRMELPAIFMLEMFRPFAGSMALLADGFAPCIGLLLGKEISQKLRVLLNDRQAVDRLIERLENTPEGEVQSRG